MGLLRRYVPPRKLTPLLKRTGKYRAGLEAESVRDFLRDLLKQAKWFDVQDSGWGSEAVSEQVTEEGLVFRKQPAEEKCREVMREFQRGEAITPRQFAGRAGVSLTTVHRLIADNVLTAWRPTPKRLIICRFLDMNKKKFLTRKNPKKGHF